MIEQLLADLRAGGDATALRNALTPIITAMSAEYTGQAFVQLVAAVEELRTNDLSAADVAAFIQERTAYAPRHQKRLDRDLLGIPESTARARTAKGKHVPRVKAIGEGLTEDRTLSRDGATWTQSDRASARVSRPNVVQEADELLSHAKTPFQRRVASLAGEGKSDEAIAAELGTTTSRIKRTITILRNRAGFNYPRDAA
jgi:uncharacterized protein YdaU (DUF1376 family)